MHINTITAQTKRAVRKWAGMRPNDYLLLDDLLDDLHSDPPDRPRLLRIVNSEFEDLLNDSISPPDWASKQPEIKTVRDLRKYIQGQMGGKQ